MIKIETAEENDFINGEFPAGNKEYWIGLTDAEAENVWKWSDGTEQTGYANWFSGQPNNIRNQDCVAMRKGQFAKAFDGEWLDFDCSHMKRFICEM